MDGELNKDQEKQVSNACVIAHSAVTQNALTVTVMEQNQQNSKVCSVTDLYKMPIIQKIRDTVNTGELIHKKTGNRYFYKGICINCTNSNDGQIMVIYKNTNGLTFCREVSEFIEKFEIY